MKGILASTTTAVIIALSVLGASLFAFRKDAVVYPVDDGAVIINTRTNEGLFHLTPLNLVTGEDEATELKSIREGVQTITAVNYPIFPSYYQTHRVTKEFYSRNRSAQLLTNAYPSVLSRTIIVENTVTLGTQKKFKMAVEIVPEDFSYELAKSGELTVKMGNCEAVISTDDKFEKTDKNMIWYSSTDTRVNFQFEITCSEK
jgi:hypothetical protein